MVVIKIMTNTFIEMKISLLHLFNGSFNATSIIFLTMT